MEIDANIYSKVSVKLFATSNAVKDI